MRRMSIPAFLRFAPVPVRARYDGWTADRQFRFVLAIARGAGPGEAARSVGMSRQTAHALRRKPGAEGFAAAWDAAAAFADRTAEAGRARPSSAFGLETVMVPRFYRGRLIGFVAREDHGAALRTLATLDRLAERMNPVDAEAISRAGLDKLTAAAVAEAAETDAIRQRGCKPRQLPADKSEGMVERDEREERSPDFISLASPAGSSRSAKLARSFTR